MGIAGQALDLSHSNLVRVVEQLQQTLTGLVNKLLTNFPEGSEDDGRICRYCTIDIYSRADCPMHTENEIFTVTINP